MGPAVGEHPRGAALPRREVRSTRPAGPPAPGDTFRSCRHDGAEPTTSPSSAEDRAARLANHVRHVVDMAPPLTAEQGDRLALALRRPHL